MTFMLPATGKSSGLPPAERPTSGFRERYDAGRVAEAIETDAWHRSQRFETEALEDLEAELGLDPYADLDAFRQDLARNSVLNAEEAQRVYARVPLQSSAGRRWRIDRALEAAAARQEAGEPVSIATREAFDQAVIDRRRAEYEDAQAVLGAGPSGAWGAELLGRLATGATDQATLAMLPFGVQGSLLRTVLAETALGVAGEAAILPRQYEVSEELGTPPPSPAVQLTIAGLTGGVLGGGMKLAGDGASRFIEYRRARDEAAAEQAGERLGEAERRVSEARQELEGDRPPSPPGARDFDYSRGGNADPNENRIGYVFGRLLERGVEPHIAAGLVGNLMQESGVAIDTRAIGDGGNAFGMAQWNGPRRQAYLAFARSRNASPDDIDTQIDFMFHEFEGSEAAAWAAIRQAATAEEAAILASKLFWRPGIPHNANRASYAATVQGQYQGGEVPRWTGAAAPGAMADAGAFTPYRTARGFTREGQVAWGDSNTIDVEYVVVDAVELRQATGDLQPRDRSRQASEAWVADTAARLDPALLMPAPTADRGTPIVGPDNVIESGNGRVRAIERAYEVAPDRAAAYRAQIEATTGEAIPEGIERPVLIARRTSELDDETRRRFVEDAQDSGVARMTATERARVGQRRLDADLLGRLQRGERLSAAANRDFARAFIGAFPRSERNAFIAEDGGLSQDGIRQIQDSLFARAWDDAQVTAMRTEAEPGDVRQLIQALDDAAPEFALLRAEVEAGLIRPEFDISGYVLDAVRIIGIARQIAAREGGSIAARLDQLLQDVDLFGNAVAPLTRALAGLFYRGGRIGTPERIGGFLSRYAEEARKAGRVSDALAGDPPDVLDVLRTVEPKAFDGIDEPGTLPEVPQRVEVTDLPEFAEGAASPEAIEADDVARAAIEEDVVDPEDIVMPVDASLPPDQVRAQIARLTEENRDRVKRLMQRIDERFGTKSGDNVKALSKVTQKAARPSILAKKPWHTVAHIRDSYRFKTVIDDIRDVPEIFQMLVDEGITLVKVDTGKLFEPKDFGWRIIAFDMRMPNGQLVEWYLPIKELEAAKKSRGHAIFEEWRNKTDEEIFENYEDYLAARSESFELYEDAAATAFQRMGMTFEEARASWSNAEKAILSSARSGLSVRQSATSSGMMMSSGERGLVNQVPSSPRRNTEPSGAWTSARDVPSSMRANSFIEDASDTDMGALRAQVKALEGDLELELEDGSTITARGLLDDIDRDQDLLTVIEACRVGSERGAA